MPSRKDLLVLSSFVLQCFPALAHPAPPGAWSSEIHYDIGYSSGLESAAPDHEKSIPSSYPFPDYANIANSFEQSSAGGPDDQHCGGGHSEGQGSWGNQGDGDGELPTVTVRDCTAGSTATATITITTDASGSGTATITETITEAATTDTVTVTDSATLTETISDCTATTTDLTTITTNGPTITSTITTAGPTVTETTTETEAAETITEPGSTETITQTSTETETETDTVTDTITNNQVITSTETITNTKTDTLEVTVTSTVTSPDCSSTPDGGSLDYGQCSDPTIKYEYGLDGRTEYAYTTNNQNDYPFGSSPTIGSVADLICNRLRSPCNAPQATIDQCYAAQSAVSGLEGQEAADTWNELMT